MRVYFGDAQACEDVSGHLAWPEETGLKRDPQFNLIASLFGVSVSSLRREGGLCAY